MNPGVYPNLPMSDYLALPAVSSGIIKRIIAECPRAAWFDSWLNPSRVRDFTPLTDAGSIAHGILLEGSTANVEVIDPRNYPAEKTGAIPDGWTNKAIRAARDEARAAGKIPVLLDQFDVINSMVSAAREFIDSLGETEPDILDAFQPDGGESEVTMVWQEGDTLCRMRVDRVSKDRLLFIDYKTSSASVEPSHFGRSQMMAQGYDVTAAWYRRGGKALCGIEPEYVFLAQENTPPYLCSLVAMDMQGRDLGERKVAAGLRIWQQCVASKFWPAYPPRVAYVEPPPWELARIEEFEAMLSINDKPIAPASLTAAELAQGIPL